MYLILCSVFYFLGFYYFYKLLKEFFNGEKTALYAVLLLLAFPTSFYFSLVYSESLFFFLSITYFYYLYKKQYLLASLFSYFIPLARPVGIYVIVPICVYMVLHIVQTHIKPNAVGFRYTVRCLLLQGFTQNQTLKTGSFQNKKRNTLTFGSMILLISAPLVGYISYLLFMFIKTSNPFEGYVSAHEYISFWNFWNIFKPEIFFGNLFSTKISLHGFTNSIIDRIFFVVFVVSLPLIYKKTGLVFLSFSLLMGTLPLFGSFMSYARYLLLVFPLFISYALFFQDKKYQFLLPPLLVILFSFQILFLVLHSLNYWVA